MITKINTQPGDRIVTLTTTTTIVTRDDDEMVSYTVHRGEDCICSGDSDSIAHVAEDIGASIWEEAFDLTRPPAETDERFYRVISRPGQVRELAPGHDGKHLRLVDHMDGDPHNNAIDNLRIVDDPDDGSGKPGQSTAEYLNDECTKREDDEI